MSTPGSFLRGTAWLACLLLCACVGCGFPLRESASGVRVVTADPPSSRESYCAWYGTRDGDILYFGQSAFWSAMRAGGGDPRADLEHRGPQPIGRLDLRSESLLEPIQVGSADSRSGVWDVIVSGGSLWYTTFFEAAGRVDLAKGDIRHLPELGPGLNEWARGPGRSILVTRYGDAEGRSGSVVMIDAAGALRDEWPLPNPPGAVIAPKTPGWDAAHTRLWLSSDALGGKTDTPIGNPTYILDLASRTWQRRDEPELHFVAFGPEGTGYRAQLSGRRLELVVAPPEASARNILLDSNFPAAFDFVQDIQPDQDGGVVVTRWSGRLHLLDTAGKLHDVQLPQLAEGGLYYSAVLRGERVCATYCAGVRVVCANATRG